LEVCVSVFDRLLKKVIYNESTVTNLTKR